MSGVALRTTDMLLRVLGALLIVLALGLGFTDARVNDVNCGSAIVPSKLEGGVLLSGDPVADEATLEIVRADCAQRVLSQRLSAAALLASAGALLWSARRLTQRRLASSAGLERQR